MITVISFVLSVLALAFILRIPIAVIFALFEDKSSKY